MSPWRPVPGSPRVPCQCSSDVIGNQGVALGAPVRTDCGHCSLEQKGNSRCSQWCGLFSCPPPASTPRKALQCGDVLTVPFPLCQSCVARIAPSLSQAVVGHPCDAVVFSVWLDPRWERTVSSWPVFGWWAEWNPGLRTSLLALPMPGHVPRFVSGNTSTGNAGVLGLGFQLPPGKQSRQAPVKSVMDR